MEAAATPPVRISRRRGLLLVAIAAATALSVVLLLPALADLPETWERLRSGDGRWLLLALAFEAVSFLGHILLFRAVSRDASTKVTMRASTEITLAGHAATRLFASAGAGGVALTAWALRRSGMDRATVAARMTTFLVLLYSVYMLALLVGGLGLYAGLLPGSAPLALTLVPAAFGGLVILVALSLPRLAGTLAGHPRLARVAPAAEAIGEGVRQSLRMVRRADLGLLGALLWWAADIAVLWACFNAFGAAPELAVIVMAYFVGMLANTLPLPGGIGGVDGGMIGALIAFGVEPSLALVAVVGYRGFAFWLPILPGAVAWVSLRRTVASWGEPDAEPAMAAPAAPATPPVAAPAPTAPRHPAAPARARRPVAVAA